MSEILAKLFGSGSRLKLIRLFLLNPGQVFSGVEILRRAKVNRTTGRRELTILKNVGFIKSKSEYIETKAKKGKPRKKKIRGWILNESFSLLYSLKNFVLGAAPLSRDQLLKKLQKVGRVKLVILSGIFVQGKEDSRADILVAGDKIKKGALERVIRDIEAEVGKELAYAAFSTQEFLYRLGMYDKFIRDILDYPHEKILDKLGV